MTRRPRAMFAPILSFCLLLLLCSSTNAQIFRVVDPGTPPAEISGEWHFHLGDDASWANPAVDDSAWEQISPNRPWGAQQHPGYTGFAWYRKRIQVDGANPALAILMPPVDDVYELYWNGRSMGGRGSMPPHAHWYAFPTRTVVPLGTAPASGVIAVRVWKAPLSSTDGNAGGGFEAAPALGTQNFLETLVTEPRYHAEHVQIPYLMTAAIMLTTGLISLVLFLRERKQRLYLWLGLYLILFGGFELRFLEEVRYGLSVVAYQCYINFFAALSNLVLWLLLLGLFGFQNSRAWPRWTVWLTALSALAAAVDLVAIAVSQTSGAAFVWIDGITTAIYSLIPLYAVVVVIAGLRSGRQTTMWPVAIATACNQVWGALVNISAQGVRVTHFTLYEKLSSWGLHLGGYSLSATFLLNTGLFLVLLLTVSQLQYRERRRQSEIEHEVKSAREVQHVLIPEEAPPIPGLSIASVYKPATELGGDFFQVMALPNTERSPGALIVLGDVSGKGLKAAMTVSLIVGTIRTLADFTSEPSEILRRLNQRLIGRVERGFATCLVVRITADGQATIANAGHMPPYLDDKELPLLGSLPLGIATSATYEQIDLHIQEDETLTLYTDGIVEARNAQGELFGFDRVTALLAARPSVQAIVDSACAFGQQDDITILTVRRVPAAEAHRSTVNLTAQIATA